MILCIYHILFMRYVFLMSISPVWLGIHSAAPAGLQHPAQPAVCRDPKHMMPKKFFVRVRNF